jgi:glycosyltransferase involved in cell wall biosynthesis
MVGGAQAKQRIAPLANAITGTMKSISQESVSGSLPPAGSSAGWWPALAGRYDRGQRFAPMKGQSLPKISVITPSYNQGPFIEDTIRSVLLQDYPHIEYIIIDGGSTDGTLEIIRKYEKWISYWESAPDRGQAHAINKGLAKVTGDICAYINSDDYYLPGAFWYAARTFCTHGWDLCLGNHRGTPLELRQVLKRSAWQSLLRPLGSPFFVGSTDYSISQESTFWSTRCATGRRFDESLHYMLDVDWFCGLASGARILRTSKEIGVYRDQPASKTALLQGGRPMAEVELVTRRWQLNEPEQHQADEISGRFRKLQKRNALSHFLFGHAEFIYTHPLCRETALGSVGV